MECRLPLCPLADADGGSLFFLFLGDSEIDNLPTLSLPLLPFSLPPLPGLNGTFGKPPPLLLCTEVLRRPPFGEGDALKNDIRCLLAGDFDGDGGGFIPSSRLIKLDERFEACSAVPFGFGDLVMMEFLD